MQKLQEWLDEFMLGKVEIPPPPPSDRLAAHTIRSFLEGPDKVWEIAITYTERLVVRSGQIAEDGIEILWNRWTTEHDVHIPMESADV